MYTIPAILQLSCLHLGTSLAHRIVGGRFLNRTIISELFFREQNRRKLEKRKKDRNEPDYMKRLFGTVVPSSVIESTEWWRLQQIVRRIVAQPVCSSRLHFASSGCSTSQLLYPSPRQKNLFAISDQAELGVMQEMVTITANDSSPELISTIRRKPFATSNLGEQCEYLLVHKRTTRAPAEKNSLYAITSYQRRVAAIKAEFFRRGQRTPLGEVRDSWDRTEAQKRGALHQHILVWFLPRELKPGYRPLAAVQRNVRGNDSKQRHRTHEVAPLPEGEYQEHHLYHAFKVGRVVAEMVRPSVEPINEGAGRWGGHCCHSLRIAGLARCIQSRFYLHQCTSRYCLLNRSSCRFFFPWPYQPQQM